MKVEVDDKSGFCFGVVNAISKAEECLAAGAAVANCRSATVAPTATLVSLGDIVHNGAEMARLEALGLEVASEDTDLATLAGRTVLIRAHGEPPGTYEKARCHDIDLIDATCPVVARLQKTVADAHAAMSDVGGRVVIFGRRGHAEIKGLAGQVGGDVTVVESAADLDALDFTRPIYFLAQTTSSLAEFRRLGDEIKRRAAVTTAIRRSLGVSDRSCVNSIRNLREDDVVQGDAVAADSQITVHDTICRQVSGREEHLAEFARRFDVVVFVSGAKSSNGRVLFEAVRNANPRSNKIESAAELHPEWFRDATSVGVCGATSTPRWLMEQIAGTITDYE